MLTIDGSQAATYVKDRPAALGAGLLPHMRTQPALLLMQALARLAPATDALPTIPPTPRGWFDPSTPASADGEDDPDGDGPETEGPGGAHRSEMRPDTAAEARRRRRARQLAEMIRMREARLAGRDPGAPSLTPTDVAVAWSAGLSRLAFEAGTVLARLVAAVTGGAPTEPAAAAPSPVASGPAAPAPAPLPASAALAASLVPATASEPAAAVPVPDAPSPDALALDAAAPTASSLPLPTQAGLLDAVFPSARPQRRPAGPTPFGLM